MMDFNSLGAQAILALVPVLTALLVFGLRKLLPKLPKVSIPIIAMALGFVLSWMNNYIEATPTVTPLVGALLGAAATWLREIVNTFNEHGTK
jgi:MFS superfamily sulfate permease-like transporter